MRLKSIEIKGFKSFADRTALHFGEDVVGIVGPNGSGKSNIVDALRWVLGEMKNRDLRLEKLGDVIFNGTKKRKAGSVAKVSLTFENTKNILPTEYHEVTISRLLYKSGDSEYRLNDVVCRRKDIMNLFVDTGIGSNSYAIIAQGMVTDIIDDRDDARRKMFEQAAGISKYKKRKKETLNKLKSTNADLERVKDLLFEIERNLKELERQARRAKRFKDLKEKYREASVKYGVLFSQNYKEEYQSLQEKIRSERESLAEKKSQFHQMEADLEEVKRKNVDKQQNVSQSQSTLNELLDEIRRSESEKEIKKQRSSFLEQDLSRLEKQLEESQLKMKGFKNELAQLDAELRKADEQQEVLREKTELAEESYNSLRSRHQDAKSDLDRILDQKRKIDHTVFDLQKTNAINQNRIETHQYALEKTDITLASRALDLKTIKSDLDQVSILRGSLLKDLEKFNEKRESRANKIEKLKQTQVELQKERDNIHRLIDRKVNEHKLLKDMAENLEGYPESVKFLNKNWSRDAPLLGDIVECDEGYKYAIEAFLEPYLNYFVAENKVEALKALSMLSSAQKGKAQFFILNAFENTKENYIAPASGLIAATDVIKVNRRYQSLMNDLLGKVWIYEGSDEITISDENIFIISKDGRFIHGRNQIKGGSIGLFEGKKIGRKKEVEKLEKALVKHRAALEKLLTRLEKIESEISELEFSNDLQLLKEKEAALKEVDQNYVGLKTRLESLQSVIKEKEVEKKVLHEQLATIEKENSDIGVSLENQQSELEEIESVIASRGGDLDQWVGKLSIEGERVNQANKALLNAQNLVNGIRQKRDFLNEQYISEERFIEEGSQRSKEHKSELESLLADLSKLEVSLLDIYSRKGKFQEELSEMEKTYFAERSEILEMEEKVRKTNRAIQHQQEGIEKTTERYNEVRLKMHSIADRLEVEFGVSLKDILEGELEINKSLDELNEEVEKLRRRIENYGEINPMALEAYEEMKLRYENIQQQRDDILEAQSSLMDTIAEIEEKATVQFLEAFNQVKVHFKEVFRSLFTEEDDCDLILSDPENPLESEIEVIARPKGKRPRTLTQLSGGEKALTAIALLFSLYLLKPAPFCVFDEVDAPFDDVNVVKFNKIIRKFSDRSQFVVITHNKITMAEVDVMYGIYMEEQGVSNVSQVDFRSHENELVFEKA